MNKFITLSKACNDGIVLATGPSNNQLVNFFIFANATITGKWIHKYK